MIEGLAFIFAQQPTQRLLHLSRTLNRTLSVSKGVGRAFAVVALDAMYSTLYLLHPSAFIRVNTRDTHCRLLPVLWLPLLLTACQPLERAPQIDPDLTLSAEPYPFGGDLTLVDHNGNAFHLADQQGPFLLFFGYVSCPDACPQTMARLASVYTLLSKDARDLTALFVSVDPKRDTPEILKTYLSHFDVPAMGLTGSQDSINAVVKRYAAHYEISDGDSAAEYLIDHSLYIYLIDQNRDLRFLFRPDHTAEEIASVVRQLFP